MSAYVRWGGAAILIIGALFLGNGYADYVKRRLAELEAFILLVDFARGRMEKYLTPREALFSDYYGDVLDAFDLPRRLRSGERAASVFEEVATALSIGEEAKVSLTSFFAHLGSDYLTGEVKRCEDTKEKLVRILEYESAELWKNVKITRLLLIAVSVGIVILLI